MQQVKCYDCGNLVPQCEAVKQREGGGNVGGGGYGHRSGGGVGGGSGKSEGKSYWLCIACDRRRVENRRFWQGVIIGIALGVVLVILVVALIVKGNK